MKLQDRLMEQSLHFYYEEGAVTSVSRREVASWRVRPWASVTYMTGGCWRVEREGQDESSFRHGVQESVLHVMVVVVLKIYAQAS